MNSRLLVSIAVPVTAFTLTIAISLWQQRSAEPTLRAAQPQLSRVAPARQVDAARSLPPPEDRRPPESPAARREPPLDAHESDPSRTDVPAKLIARARPGSPGLVASLINTTAEDLTVTIAAVSARTHMRSSADVTLQGHERHNLAADGLELESGDQVTIHSPPFRDAVVTAQ